MLIRRHAAALLGLLMIGSATPLVAGKLPPAGPVESPDALLDDEAATPAPDTPEAPDAPLTTRLNGFHYASSDDLLEFDYRYPQMLVDAPAFDTMAQMEMQSAHEEYLAAAQESKKAAEESEYGFNPFYFSSEWTVVGANDALISMRNDVADFTGGAHGNYGYRAMLYDRATDTLMIDPAELFADRAQATEAVQGEFCRLLNEERSARREEPVNPDDLFGECLDPVTQAISFSTNAAGKFDRMHIDMGPYLAGPYAEGAYGIDMPVTEALIAAVEPKWQQSFAVSTAPGFADNGDSGAE